MKKRFLSLIMALCMAAALLVPAAAAGTNWSGALSGLSGAGQEQLYILMILNSATSAKSNVATSKDGTDVPTWQQWTTPEVMADFTAKLDRAHAYYLSWAGLTTDQKNEASLAALMLQEAITPFKNSLKYGYLSDTPVTPAEPEPPFPDVPKGEWYYDYVCQVKEKKLFGGFQDGTFGPGKNMTINQFFAVLYQFSGENRTMISMEDYMDWAMEKSLIPSAMQRATSPSDAITRQQMAAVFDAFLKAYNVSYTPVTTDTPSFSDQSSIAEYARDGVVTCWKAGIMGGTGGAFAPGNTATRAQVAVTMVQMARVMGK